MHAPPFTGFPCVLSAWATAGSTIEDGPVRVNLSSHAKHANYAAELTNIYSSSRTRILVASISKERSMSTPGPNPNQLSKHALLKSSNKTNKDFSGDRVGQLWTTTQDNESNYLVVDRNDDYFHETSGDFRAVWQVQVFTRGRYVKTMTVQEGVKPWEKFTNLRRIG